MNQNTIILRFFLPPFHIAFLPSIFSFFVLRFLCFFLSLSVCLKMGLRALFERGARVQGYHVIIRSQDCSQIPMLRLVFYAHLGEKHCDGVTVTEFRETQKGGSESTASKPCHPKLTFLTECSSGYCLCLEEFSRLEKFNGLAQACYAFCMSSHLLSLSCMHFYRAGMSSVALRTNIRLLKGINV